MDLLLENEEFIRTLVEAESKTHREVSEILKERFPDVHRGFSPRNIREFCRKADIHKLNGDRLDNVVRQAVEEVGPAYGRKMMTGHLASKGIIVKRQRLVQTMRRVAPGYHQARREDTVRRTNPIPYYAPYHGHKLHIDQNEKLKDFGVTHILFSDGFSSKIVGSLTLPIKNAVMIYDIFRRVILTQGLWDMVRVDHGTEFTLVLFIQNYLSQYRGNQNCLPYIQTPSSDNLPAERKWPEVNQRVNYPVKEALIGMQQQMLIEMADITTKFCVSFVTTGVVEVGMKRCIESWNNHPLEDDRRRIPNVNSRDHNRTAQVSEHIVPTVQEAIQMYEQSGGHLTTESYFGVDPLRNNHQLIAAREAEFLRVNPSFDVIFNHVTNGDSTLLKTAVLSFISITKRLGRL